VTAVLLLETAATIDPLKTPQLVLALVVAFTMLAIVLELVRRQKLREEYSILWVSTALVLIVLALSTGVTTWLSDVFQTESLVSILYFGALVFLMLVALQFSVRLTKLTFRGKTLNQRIALLEAEIDELRSLVEEQTSAEQTSAEGPTGTIPRPPNDAVAETAKKKNTPRDKVS
jgi:small basic protein